MTKQHITLITFHLLIFFFTTTTTAQGPPDSSIYHYCSPITFAPDSTFSTALTTLLTALTNSAAASPYNQLDQSGGVQGVFQCQGGRLCFDCVSGAVSSVTAACPYATGAIVQLPGCYLKYSARHFLGIEDTTVLFKRCGPPGGPDGLGPDRDSVFNGLVNGPGPMYKEMKSGSVRGMTQCIGDLSVDQCTNCVDQAVGLLRSECGSAPYGDVFLVTCYARFSVHRNSDHGILIPIRIRSWKTIEIIAGLVVAAIILVLLIIFSYRKYVPSATTPAPPPAGAQAPAPTSATDAAD